MPRKETKWNNIKCITENRRGKREKTKQKEKKKETKENE